MIKTMKTTCPWCHRTIHAIKVRKEYVASCGVCQDSFVVPKLSTESNCEDGDGDE